MPKPFCGSNFSFPSHSFANVFTIFICRSLRSSQLQPTNADVHTLHNSTMQRSVSHWSNEYTTKVHVLCSRTENQLHTLCKSRSNAIFVVLHTDRQLLAIQIPILKCEVIGVSEFFIVFDSKFFCRIVKRNRLLAFLLIMYTVCYDREQCE